MTPRVVIMVVAVFGLIGSAAAAPDSQRTACDAYLFDFADSEGIWDSYTPTINEVRRLLKGGEAEKAVTLLQNYHGDK